MFPYPSGSGLHVGHPEGYTATDIIARYKRATGHNVLHPIGWDAFGLPAEQYAIQTGTHPAVTTAANVDRFRSQLQALGFSYDWDREVSTAEPRYYKWTQWIFLQLFKRGLAYQATVPVNWCPALGTVLANEEVVGGVSERGGHPVTRLPMKQWMLRITAYGDRLLAGLDGLDWDESIKDMQRNWIGRSEGADIAFALAPGAGAAGAAVAAGAAGAALPASLSVFTTRPDTLFGVTYLCVAPEHPAALALATPPHRAAVAAYISAAASKSDLERTELQKEKSGVATGSHALNPATGEALPIWVADYVLGTYGSGAVMAVPAHDDRDAAFAATHGLPVRTVVLPSGGGSSEAGAAFTGEGVAAASSNPAAGLVLDGLCSAEARAAVTAWLETHSLGAPRVNFKLRDWLFARQRYWGEPFPIVYPAADGEDALPVALPESSLPLTLPPMVNFQPSGTPDPPLATVTDWITFTCPDTGVAYRREASTMPQWAGSCWYYLRYLDPADDASLVSPALEKYWMPVDLYVGGAEHAVLHLLYARFWHKVLFDLGVVSTDEPFQRLVSQGMILGEVEWTAWRAGEAAAAAFDPAVDDGLWAGEGEPGAVAVRVPESAVNKKGGPGGVTPVLAAAPAVRATGRAHKMSKSRGNVINPDDVVSEFGADALRLYEMFLGPLRDTKVWNTRAVDGVFRFLARAHRLATATGAVDATGLVEPTLDQARLTAATIARVTADTEGMRFNTAIAGMMEFVNGALKWPAPRPAGPLRDFAQLLAPYAPHLGEELWEALGGSGSLAYEPWPVVSDPALLEKDSIVLPVQVNGKLRGTVELAAGTSAGDAEAAARALPAVAKLLEGVDVKKTIFVQDKILNFIAPAGGGGGGKKKK
jgi:leucyl-tRNA synthetase